MNERLTRVMVCGAGKIAGELLGRMGDGWSVTLVDTIDKQLDEMSRRFGCVSRVVAGDASSPVVLDDAGLPDQDFVLALTNRDAVNLAIAGFARQAGVTHVMSVSFDSSYLPRFQELGVKTLSLSTWPAKSIYHFLQDPRVDVTLISHGQGEVLEVEAPEQGWALGKRLSVLNDDKWRASGLFRDGELLFPSRDLKIRAGDRIVFLGRQDIFGSVCSILECQTFHFPMQYGQSLLMAMPRDREDLHDAIMDESLHIAQNTRIRKMITLCAEGRCTIHERVRTWTGSMEMETRQTDKEPRKQLAEITARESIGLVVLPPPEGTVMPLLQRSNIISLAHSIDCPLLAAKGTHPYRRLLVPFNNTFQSRSALETGFDLARQLNAELAVVIVQEPDFIHSSEDNGDNWVEEALETVRKLSMAYKLPVREVVLTGNPVLETVKQAEEADLMIIGSSTRETGLFSPHVGESLAKKSPCSVLILAPVAPANGNDGRDSRVGS